MNDAYEPDDARITSGPRINKGDTQFRNFCDDSEDWVSFKARRNREYTFAANPVGRSADIALELYDRKRTVLLVAEYGGPGMPATIVWQAPRRGLYHVKVLQCDSSMGMERGYALTLTEARKRRSSHGGTGVLEFIEFVLDWLWVFG